MSGTPVLPKNRVDLNVNETEGHRLSPTPTKMSASKGFFWIMVWTAFWMSALFGFYELTDKILGR